MKQKNTEIILIIPTNNILGFLSNGKLEAKVS
jgi:hypothetical protein